MNRHNTVDLKGQLFKAKKASNKKTPFGKDVSLLMIVGVIGCIGTLFIFNKSWISEKNASGNTLTTITIPPSIISLTPMDKSFLIISGDYLIHKSLNFTIPDFNSKAIYEVNFGDGKIQKFKTQNFNHTYSEDGFYYIEMKMIFKEESTILFETKVEITDPNKNLISFN